MDSGGSKSSLKSLLESQNYSWLEYMQKNLRKYIFKYKQRFRLILSVAFVFENLVRRLFFKRANSDSTTMKK